MKDFRRLSGLKIGKNMANMNEMDWKTYDAAATKAKQLSNSPDITTYEAERRKNQAEAFRDHAIDTCDKQFGVDKVKQRKDSHEMDRMLGKTKMPFSYTNGELKRLDRQANDVQDWHEGNLEYRDGKYVKKESRNIKMKNRVIRLTESQLQQMIGKSVKKCLKEWTFSPDQLDDKAYMDDYYTQREKMTNADWERRNIAIRKKYPGKTREWYEAMLDIESKHNNKPLTEESFQNNQGYSHFAVNKATNKIVNGWDYSEYDSDELRQFKYDYFTRDLIDYDLDPKQYKIVTGKFLLRQGIDPNDNNNWANS